MRFLLNGAAIVAALAVATPVWAQGAATPGVPSPNIPPASTTHHPARHVVTRQMQHRRPVREHAAMRREGMHGSHAVDRSSGDRMTDDLNRQELSRINADGSGTMPSHGGPSMQPPPPMTAPPPPPHP
jgi:hypothetical protein